MNSTVDFRIKVEELSCEIKTEPQSDTDITAKSCIDLLKLKEQDIDTPPGSTVCEKNLEEQDDLHLEKLPEYKESYDSYINEVKALATIPIIKSVTEEHIKNFKHFNERYYEDKYCINFGITDPSYCDIVVRIHTNKLILIALASGNDIIRNNEEVTHINFVINNNDRSDIHLKGKRKRGSKAVERGTILCQVTCEGGRTYNVRAGISAKIIEINQHIKTNPNLLRSDPKRLGFIAVLTPHGRPDCYEQTINQQGLLSEKEYNQYLLTRPPKFADLDTGTATESTVT